MKTLSCSEWIDHFLGAEPPRSKSLVMTVLGDAIAPHGGAVWLGSLIELVEPLTVTDRLARTSVFRLVQEGWLEATREGRRSRYAFAPASLPRFARANQRIYSRPVQDWDGHWTLLLTPNGTLDMAVRTALRKELQWEGFGQLAAGVLAHPAPNLDSLAEILERTEAQGKLFVCSASQLPQVASRPLAELVDDGWDLSDVVERYSRFVETFSPLLDTLQDGPPPTPQLAWMVRALLVHAYRRVQLHDPMLPLALLPPLWPGSYAYELARAVYLRTFEAAEVHLMDVLKREDPEAPAADAAFYQRFGGLH
jgi:phenylacetic acid degradation operon negative regulatory protein